jgi:hypothetical protein
MPVSSNRIIKTTHDNEIITYTLPRRGSKITIIIIGMMFIMLNIISILSKEIAFIMIVGTVSVIILYYLYFESISQTFITIRKNLFELSIITPKKQIYNYSINIDNINKVYYKPLTFPISKNSNLNSIKHNLKVGPRMIGTLHSLYCVYFEDINKHFYIIAYYLNNYEKNWLKNDIEITIDKIRSSKVSDK